MYYIYIINKLNYISNLITVNYSLFNNHFIVTLSTSFRHCQHHQTLNIVSWVIAMVIAAPVNANYY